MLDSKYKKGDFVRFRWLGGLEEREVIDEPQFDRGEYTYNVGMSTRVRESDIVEALIGLSQE